MAEGYSEGNSLSASDSHRLSVEVYTTSASTSGRGGDSHSSSSRSSISTSKRGRAQKEPVQEVMDEGTVFLGAPSRSDLQDRPSTHFPNPRVMCTLKRPVLEKKYLLPTGYKFIIPDPNATVNKPARGCIAIYRATFSYGLRFPLYKVIVDMLNKYKLAPLQVVPTFWHNVCSFIATCELRGISCTCHALGLVHTIQKAPSETRDTGWYSLNNRKSFITAI